MESGLKSTTNHGSLWGPLIYPNYRFRNWRSKIDQFPIAIWGSWIRSNYKSVPIPRFSIIDQTPRCSSKVLRRQEKYITYCKFHLGYKKVTIPNIIQVTQRERQILCSKLLGLKVERVTYVGWIGKGVWYTILNYKGKYYCPWRTNCLKTSENRSWFCAM